jgi:hypothetical protein
MGPTLSRASSITATTAANADLAAARALMKSYKFDGSSEILKYLPTTIGVSAATSAVTSKMSNNNNNNQLSEARRAFANFLYEGEFVKFPIHNNNNNNNIKFPSNSHNNKNVSDFLMSILEGIQRASHRFSQALANVVKYLLNNPKILLAGSVSVLAVTGVTYLVVKKSSLLGMTNSNSNNDENNNTVMTSISNKQQPPDHLCCPLSLELFVDPVIVSSGHTYERAQIAHWIQTQQANNQEPTCPTTRQPIGLESIHPNWAVKKAVDAYLEENQHEEM